MGLWQESGAMQRHKFLGEAAEAPEITSVSPTARLAGAGHERWAKKRGRCWEPD